MPTIRVVRAGLLTTVQDRGRFGYRASGVSTCGALDPVALAAANCMAGNERSAAAVEITLGGITVVFSSATRFAIAGADARATLDDVGVPSWSCALARAGQTLRFGAPTVGMRTVLAIGGGIDVAKVLGSRSTDLATGFGGMQGRALQAGDALPIGEPRSVSATSFRLKPPQWELAAKAFAAGGIPIRALPGGELTTFSQEAQQRFWSTEWQVSSQSNRMGYRLDGASVPPNDCGALRSHALTAGVVQVPPGGRPILLLSDAQTTGGYAKIAVVIEADLWKVAQVRIGEQLRFVKSTLDQAREAGMEVEAYLMAIERTISNQLHAR